MSVAHLINLDSRVDRLNKTLEEFKNINSLKIQRHQAVVANPDWKTNTMNAGLVACTISHLNILKDNVNNNENILILEDDVKLTDKNNFDTNWTNIKIWLDSNDDKWDIFLGGAVNIKNKNIKKILCNKNKIIHVSHAYTAHFIYYNHKYIKTLLNNINPYIHGIDWWKITCPNIRITTCYPFLAHQYSDFSDIRNDECYDWTIKFIETEKIIKKTLISKK